jgi:hypothetical protein
VSVRSAAARAPVSLDVLDLLVLVTAERFGGESALLRRQAVVVGTLDSDRAIERRVELAISPVETDSVRIAAIGALPRCAVESLREQLDDDPSETVHDYVRSRLGGEPPERRKIPGQSLEEARSGPDRRC